MVNPTDMEQKPLTLVGGTELRESPRHQEGLAIVTAHKKSPQGRTALGDF